MQWDVIMNLYFYDFQNILQSYAKILEDRRKEEEDDMKKQGYDDNRYSPDTMMRQTQKSISKMPNISIPKL